jgi:dihydroflavonol-4-reductase
LDAGFHVRGIVHQRDLPPLINNNEIELFQGSLHESGLLKRIVSGVDCVIHAAALSTFMPVGIDDLMLANRDITLSLAKAAAESGIRKFIFISTRATLGTASDPELSDESLILRREQIIDPYARSKREAEEGLADVAEKYGMHYLILHPTAVVGAEDAMPTPIGTILRSTAHGRVLFAPPGGINVVGVVNAAAAIVRSVNEGLNRERYIIGGHNIILHDFLALVARHAGVRPPLIKAPAAVTLAGANAIAKLCLAIGRTAPINPDKIKALIECRSYCCSRKAVSLLGLEYTPIDSLAAQIANYFKKYKFT